MTRMDRKVLPIAIALLLALAARGGANALTITSLSGLDTSSYRLTTSDLNLSGWSYEGSRPPGSARISAR